MPWGADSADSPTSRVRKLGHALFKIVYTLVPADANEGYEHCYDEFSLAINLKDGVTYTNRKQLHVPLRR